MATNTQDQNIGTFYQIARERDFARKFQFRIVQLGVGGVKPEDLIYAETAVLPGRTINNIAVPYMGLSFNVPGVASYPGSAGYKITFRCDKDYHLRSVIERELFRTFDDATSSGQYSIPGQDSVLSMVLTNKQNIAIRQYNLYGCYVQSIDDEGYDIKDTGNVVSINTTICYQYWKVVIPAGGFQQVTGRDSAGT
jgi:hypothetical protein